MTIYFLPTLILYKFWSDELPALQWQSFWIQYSDKFCLQGTEMLRIILVNSLNEKKTHILLQFNSVQFSHSVVSNSLQPHGLQHTRLPCPSSTPRVYSDSYPLSQWCHPTISSSVVPFSSCLKSFPESGSFLMSQFFDKDHQDLASPCHVHK